MLTDMNNSRGSTYDDDLLSHLRAFAEGYPPDYLFRPCTSAEAAEVLGISPDALKVARHRGKGPPGWAQIPGVGWRYKSRLDILTWLHNQHRQACLELSQRDAA